MTTPSRSSRPLIRDGRSCRYAATCWHTAAVARTASPSKYRRCSRRLWTTAMPERPELITAYPPPDSPARTRPPTRQPLRVGAVQERWHPEPEEHESALATGIELAAGEGARLVCLQELTLSPYFAITPDGPKAAGVEPEDLQKGPTVSFARRMAEQTGA